MYSDFVRGFEDARKERPKDCPDDPRAARHYRYGYAAMQARRVRVEANNYFEEGKLCARPSFQF